MTTIEDYKRCERCKQRGGSCACEWWEYYWNAYWLASPWGLLGVIITLLYSVLITFCVVGAVLLAIF